MEFGFSEAQRSLFTRMEALGRTAQEAAAKARLGVLAQGGALGLSLPAAHGGGGFDFVSTAHAYVALGRTLSDGGALLAAGAHLFGVATVIAKLGAPSLKALWLPKLATGEVIATVCATEEASGSDISSAQTVAEPLPDGGFRLTGSKRYVTSAARAGLFFVVAKNSAGRGLTTLLVPGDSPGITVGEPLATAGLRGAGLAPVTFDGCKVAAGSGLGTQGGGILVFQHAMMFERALILAFRVGAMEVELERSIEFAKRRRLGETPLAKIQAVAHRIAKMKLRLETARLLTYRAAWQLDQTPRGESEAALAKWHVADSAMAFALDAIKLRGGAGYLEESGLPRALDDAIGGAIHSGTEDVLPNIVAAWLGL